MGATTFLLMRSAGQSPSIYANETPLHSSWSVWLNRSPNSDNLKTSDKTHWRYCIIMQADFPNLPG